MEIFIQVIGWIGTILIVLAYFLVSKQYIQSNSKAYQMMNLFGAIGSGIYLFNQQAWPSVILQIVWSVIAIATLIKLK